MMMPGDENVAAERLYAVLSKHKIEASATPSGEPVSVAGEWEAQLQFSAVRPGTLFFWSKKARISWACTAEKCYPATFMDR